MRLALALALALVSAAAASATQSHPTSFNFYTVDDPAAYVLHGISNLQKIRRKRRRRRIRSRGTVDEFLRHQLPRRKHYEAALALGATTMAQVGYYTRC